jgi:hypothetical protein
MQYPIPMTMEKKGQTELFIGNWLKSRPRDKVAFDKFFFCTTLPNCCDYRSNLVNYVEFTSKWILQVLIWCSFVLVK